MLSGGLGHFGVLWAKALGAEVWALSTSDSKKDDALKLGATGFINTRSENWAEPHKFKFDYLINCANATDKFNLSDYFSILKVNGIFHNVGFPNNPINNLQVQIFAPTGCYFGASHIGNRPEMIAMLDLAAKKGVKSWVETIDISEEGCAQAVKRLDANDIKYRFTLTGFDKVFGKRA
jgi:alcohol dehydrogenase (NADP+)